MQDLTEPACEAWLTGVDCRIANGPFAGKTLGQAWLEMTAEWRGRDFEGERDFPLLLKFIFPKDKLSIQVHPDDAYAAKYEQGAGGRGKTEMWHIVSAERGARLLAGLKPSVTKEKFCAALADHTLEELFQSHQVQAGDTFFLPAGTAHTIGPGMIVCEVQEYSDLTYRVYDYGRVDASGKPRELHVEKALQVIDFDSHPEVHVRGNRSIAGEQNTSKILVSCAYFDAVRFDVDSDSHSSTIPEYRNFALWTFLDGEGFVEWSCKAERAPESRRFAYAPGECWFMPANFGSAGFRPRSKTSVLIARPRNPKLDTTQGGRGR